MYISSKVMVQIYVRNNSQTVMCEAGDAVCGVVLFQLTLSKIVAVCHL